MVYNPNTGQYENTENALGGKVTQPQFNYPDNFDSLTPEQQLALHQQNYQAQLYGGGMQPEDIQDAIAKGYLNVNDLATFSNYQGENLKNRQAEWALAQSTGYDKSGKPIQKEFNTLLDPDTGLLKENLQLKTNLNTGALEGMRAEANRTGPSAWRTLAETQAGDQLAKQSAGQLAQARGQMSMQGGLRGGSAERLAQQSMMANLTGKQNIANQYATQDEQNRLATQDKLAGQELAYSGYDRDTSKYNTDKALAETLQQRGYDINAYNEAMRAWGATQTAAATPTSSGGKK